MKRSPLDMPAFFNNPISRSILVTILGKLVKTGGQDCFLFPALNFQTYCTVKSLLQGFRLNLKALSNIVRFGQDNLSF